MTARVARLASHGIPDTYNREEMYARPYSKGLEATIEDSASRSWLRQTPRGKTGRDLVRAVQLRTNNLPHGALPYGPQESRRNRGECDKLETICKDVPSHEQINRHDEVVAKIVRHSRRKGWETTRKARLYHQDGQLFIPDIVAKLPGNTIIVCDA